MMNNSVVLVTPSHNREMLVKSDPGIVMERCSRLVVGILTSVLVGASASDSSSTNNTTVQQTSVAAAFEKSTGAKDYLQLSPIKTIALKCMTDYTMICLKMDLLHLMDHFNSKGNFEILPGLALIRKSYTYTPADLPAYLIAEISRGQRHSMKELDAFLLQKIEDFLKTFTFQLQPQNPQILRNIKTTGSEVIDTLATSSIRTGRSRKASLLWSAGILAAIGFAALSAVAGKALMASLMALIVAAFTAFRGVGGAAPLSGYKSAHYEIITKPVHYSAPAFTGPAHYYDHDHHGSSYSPAYDYARTISLLDKVRNDEETIKDSQSNPKLNTNNE